MLDIKRIRESLEDIKKAMNRRGEKEFNLDEVVELDDKRKELQKIVLNMSYHCRRSSDFNNTMDNILRNK